MDVNDIGGVGGIVRMLHICCILFCIVFFLNIVLYFAWVEEGSQGEQILLHSYYEKPVTSKLVLMKKSAIQDRTKCVVMAQEVIHRLRNTSPKVSSDEKAAILSKLMMKMAKSGYNLREKEDALRTECEGYFRKRWRERVGGRRVNRIRGTNAEARAARKLLGPVIFLSAAQLASTSLTVSK